MPVNYWMITNRNVVKRGSKKDLGNDHAELTFYTSSGDGAVDDFSNWNEQSGQKFQTALVAAADKFPALPQERHEEQKHVAIFVHGYNNTWRAAAKRYERLVQSIFDDHADGTPGLGICVLFTWPSDGSPTDYLPDRADARRSAEDFTQVLSRLYDWLMIKQTECATGSGPGCKAKTSVIAHSMGNYVVQCAMQYAWTRKNRPLLVSLINQLAMVAADVDNDIFKDGEDIGDSDGEGIANLTYRVTALYSGRDPVLGMSAGLKHFGKRRLGRSGLDRAYKLPDNVWDVDCSPFFSVDEKNIHSAYFETPRTLSLLEHLLRGIDRGVLVSTRVATPDASIPVTATPTTEHRPLPSEQF